MPEAIRVFIVDDEAPARARLRRLLDDCADTMPNEVVGEAASGPAALAELEQVVADVVLLDIRMPGMDGVEVARRLAGQAGAPQVVFVTAYDAHAVTAFELGARDYLLKPVRVERLIEALRRVMPAGGPRMDRFITVTDRGRVMRVPLDEVLYLRAELKYVTLRTREREFVLDEPLTKLEEGFPDDLLRIHRSCLVNRRQLAGFEVRRDGEDSHWVALLTDWPETLPVSRRQAHVIREFRQVGPD
ncbi:MAG: response regulator transcription factor [Thiobacillus sp.]|nr:response regulator transcription factor [Thiobacillus sp.]